MTVVKPKLDCTDKSIQTYLFLDDYAFHGLYFDDQEVLCYEKPFCKHCNSYHVIRKDHNTRKVFNSHGNLINFKIETL